MTSSLAAINKTSHKPLLWKKIATSRTNFQRISLIGGARKSDPNCNANAPKNVGMSRNGETVHVPGRRSQVESIVGSNPVFPVKHVYVRYFCLIRVTAKTNQS